MPWLVALAFFGMAGYAWSQRHPGALKVGEFPHTDEQGRVYYDVFQWDGRMWQLYGRRYLGGAS